MASGTLIKQAVGCMTVDAVSDLAFMLVRLRLLVVHDYLHAAIPTPIAGSPAPKVVLIAVNGQFQMREGIHTAKAIQVTRHSPSSVAWFPNLLESLGPTDRREGELPDQYYEQYYEKKLKS